MTDQLDVTPCMEAKAKAFLRVLKAQAGNISAASEAAGIDRRTFYNWCERSPEFKEAVEEIREGMIYFAESKLMQNINDGKEASTIFFLKTRGAKMGYQETQRVEHEGAVPVVDIEREKRKARALLEEQGES